MNDPVLAISHLSPCVRMFVESLVGDELARPWASRVPLVEEFLTRPVEAIAIAKYVRTENGPRFAIVR
jgi:mitochondrial fission protein ELM1